MRAWAVLSRCMRPEETWINNKASKNEFYFWIDELDWVDSRHSFITWSNWTNIFKAEELAALKKNAFYWALPIVKNFKRPWVWASKLDLDKNSYYIARNPDWTVKTWADWKALYVWKDTWEILDQKAIDTKKEKFLVFFTRDSKKMISAPIWWRKVKEIMYSYVEYIKKHHPTLMTEAWFDQLKRSVNRYFNKVENWTWDQWWFNVIYDLFLSPLWNHWYLMSKVMPDVFNRMLSDREVADNLLWYNFSDVTFRQFSEAAAVYANQARWWNFTVVDALWTRYADKIYWAEAPILFEEKDWKMVRTDWLKMWHINKTYLMKLSLDQQIEQVRAVSKELPSFSKFWMFMKIKLWYNWRWRILRFINKIWSPAFYSALMTFWKWLVWFMPLLILNSWMFVTDTIARWHRLNWDWKALFKKWNLWDWLPETVQWYSAWIWETLWDMSRQFYSKATDALNQWLFNVWDLLMENSYKVRQYQLFFEAQFPWIKNVSEIDEILTIMRDSDPDQLERLLNAAKWYTEYSIRLSTTNTPVLASLVRVHAAKNPINQPMLDTWYVMWNFFSGWWFNKIAWAWKILKEWFWNIYHWRIWAKYLDDLLSAKVEDIASEWKKSFSKWKRSLTSDEIHSMMVTAYLENEQFIYTLHKIYIAMMIWKYLDRLTEDTWEKNNETVFDDFSDMLSYMDIFAWDYAALTANPQWRIVKNFWDMFIWELENNASIWTATKAATAAATKEAFRSFFRKLYMPQIATEYVSLLNANWDSEEVERLKNLKKSIQDNVNWYLYYLKDTTENWNYDYYIPRWPNSYVNSILGKTSKSIEFVNDQKMLSKLANLSWWLFDDNSTFHNWVIYSFPFLKQRNISQIADVEEFIDDHDAFRRMKEYNQMVNWEFPDDMQNQDWEYAYNIITRRLVNDKDKISDDSLFAKYSFINDEWWTSYDKNRQNQEYILHHFMSNWLTEQEAENLYKRMKWKTNWYDEEAIRTLAYMEAKTPGSSLQAVAYLMNEERFNYVYRSWVKYEWQALEDRKYQWKIEAAKKYQEYIPYIDRYITWPQFILHYAKTHDTPLAKYIEWPGDYNAWSMKLVTPWSTEEKDWFIRQNQMLVQNFQAQLMVDIEWANWNPDARKLMNWFALIFNTKKYENTDWTLNSKYAAYALNQLETIYNHIDSLAMDENSKHILKQWTLMFWDKLFTNVIKDDKLMEREDVQQVVKDWTTYWYWEFRELDQIAIDAAEDQLSNREWRSYWAKKDYLTSWLNRKFSWFMNRYDYMKNRAYSSNYMKYRVFDWVSRSYEKNYLSKYDFNDAQMAAWWWKPLDKKSSSKWKKSKDDWIWVTTRRWKSIQFYKREDPDKPVEYKLPRRKRWVRKWSWVKPISPTTWKHLTPKPKTNG